jgi:hypothetical protein
LGRSRAAGGGSDRSCYSCSQGVIRELPFPPDTTRISGINPSVILD